MDSKLIVLAVVILAATVAEARYFRINGRMNFFQAKAQCKRRGARLAIVSNSRQNAAVLRLFRGVRKGQVYWIGLSDRRREGQWKWENGRPLRYRYFARGEPNNAGNQDCAAVNFNNRRQWDDRRCNERVMGAVCQTVRKPKPKAGYFRVNGRMNYGQAKRACARRGARLAVILNARQNAASLRAMRGVRKSRPYWIGLSDSKREGRWRWINGRPLRYRYFARGEPNNAGGNQDCAVINFNNARQWDDRRCTARVFGALCQKVRKCPKTRVIRGRCNRRGLRAVKHIYYAIRGGRCRRKVFIKRVRCGGHGKFCRCSAVGDPHYRTFDGHMIHFYGICKYTLAKSIGGGACAFDVQVKNERRGRNRRVSYTRFVEVKMGGRTFRLDQRRRVYVDNTIQAPPIRAGKIRVFYSGRLVQFVHTSCGVRVAFDGRSNAYLQVSGRFRGKMTGICGSCNGNRADDMTTKNGKRVRGKRGYNLIGDSYAVKDDSPGRHRCKSKVPTPPQPKRWCKGAMVRLIKTAKFCGGLLNPRGPFGKCMRVARINPKELFNSCKIDVCANAKNRAQQRKSKCQAFKALEERCNEKGITGIKWRNRYGCPLHCGTNKVYSTNMNPCPRTCENHFLGTKSMCFKLPRREGCQCKPGFLRDGALCVKPKDCKCLELCLNKEKTRNCRRWKKEGRCTQFPRYMRGKCALTCGFCKKRPKICEDRISTRRCMKFRRQGKCKYAFFRNICGLSCNLKGCPCKKSKKKTGPCRKNKTRRVTITRYVRSRRTHRCVKIVRSYISRCGRCPRFRKVRLTPCNVCKRFRFVVTFSQRRVGKRCVRRTSRRRVRCKGCRGGRVTRRCVSHRIRLIFVSRRVPNKRCNRCVTRVRRKRIVIRCPKPRVSKSACNRITRRKTVTKRYYYARNCRCRVRIRRYSFPCICPKSRARTYCDRRRRRIVTVVTKFVLRKRRCIRIRRVRRRLVRCPRAKYIRGRCRPHPVCHRVDTRRRYVLDRRCRCKPYVQRKAVRCCCAPKRKTKKCIRRLGRIQTTTTTYRLVYSRRLRRPICIKRRRVRLSRMLCRKRGRTLIRRSRCRRPRCLQYFTYVYRHRVGCKCFRRKVVLRRRCCCRLPVRRTRCIRNRYVRTVRSWKLIRGRCRASLRRYTSTGVRCPKRRVYKGRCNKRTRRQYITYVYYILRRCRCFRRKRRTSRLCSCGPNRVTLSRCNRRTCRQTKTTIIRVGPIRGRCITERRRRILRCCCRRSSTRKVCNRRIGYRQIITVKYTFVRRTRSCIRRRYVRTIYRPRCGRPSRRVYPCRGYFRKIVYTRSYRIRRLCRCKNVVRVVTRRCRCPPPRKLRRACYRNRRFVTYTRYYILRRGRCIRRIKRSYGKRVPCRVNRRVIKGKCNRACRQLIRVSYSFRRNCRCYRRNKRYTRLCCCKGSKTKRCVRGNRRVTTTNRPRLNRRRTRCIPRITRRVKMISCRRKHIVRRGGCNRRTCRKVYFYTRFAVRRCKCVVVRRYRRSIVCCCRPAYRKRTRCIRNVWITTIRRRVLIRGRCYPRNRRYARRVRCRRPRRTVTKCNRRTRRYSVTVVFYRNIRCKCRRYRRRSTYYCACPPRKFFKGRCNRRANVRVIYRSTFVLKRNKRGCRKITRAIAREPCYCKRPRKISRCVGPGRRITRIYFLTKYVRVRGSRLRRRVCLKRVSNRFIRKRCGPSVVRPSPCRRRRRFFRKYFWIVRRCRCYRRSRIIKYAPCNCRGGSIRRRCYRNVYKQAIITSYVPRGTYCIKKVTRRNTRVRCRRRPSVRKIRGCNLRIGYTYYNTFLRTSWRTIRCRCSPLRRRFRVPCRCLRPLYKRKCIGRTKVFIKIYYVRTRTRCLRRRKRTTNTVVCRPRVKAYRLGCNRRTCNRKIRLFFTRRNRCKCVRKSRYVSQRCCCLKNKPRPGVRPGSWKYRGCYRGYKVYTNTRYVLRPTRYFKVRIGRRYYVRIVSCRAIKKTIKKRHTCKLNMRITKRCNKRTGVFYRIKSYTVRRGCRCVRVRRVTRSRCSCPRRKLKYNGPCKRGRYFRTVTTKTLKLRRGKCVWITRRSKKRCRCRQIRRTRRCDGRGRMVTTITTVRLVRGRCVRKTYRRSKPVKCGRASTKERVIVGRCIRNKIRVTFTRVVLNKARCKCVRKRRVRYYPCRCPKGGVIGRGCIRNVLRVIVFRRYIRIGFRCIPRRGRITKRIRCSRTPKYKLLPCIKRLNRRTLLTIVKRAVKCRCKPFVTKKIIPCACKTMNKYRKVCISNNVFRVTYERGYRRGFTCLYKKFKRFVRVRCARRPRTRALRCNRKTCRRTYVKSVIVPRKCKCKRVVVKRFSRICCCKRNPSRSKVCRGNAYVITIAYTVRRGWRCYRVVRRRVSRVRCSRRRWSRKVCSRKARCNGVRRYYRFKVVRCKCKPSVYGVRRVKCCCKRNRVVRRCLARRGVFVTTRYRSYLRGDRCRTTARSTLKRIRCVGIYKKLIRRCKRNVRIVAIIQNYRRACKCFKRILRKFSEPCKCPKKLFVKKTKCRRYFKIVSVYRKVYRRRRRRGYCATVLVKRYRERCRCRKGNKRTYCARHYIRVTIKTRYILTRRRPKRCIKKRTVKRRPMGGCRLRPKLVRKRKGACNKRSRMRLITRIFVVARNCRCRKFRRVKRVRCVCPRKSRRTLCYRNNYLTITVYYITLRRGDGVICRKRVKRTVRKVRCRTGVSRKFGRCFRRRGRRSQRYITYYRHYKSRCRCYKRVFRRIVAPCSCRRIKKIVRCTRFWKIVRVIIYRFNRSRTGCTSRAIVERRKIKCKRGISRRNTKCRGNTYFIVTTRGYVRKCKCYKRVSRRRCDCRCPKNKVTRRCSGRYLIYVYTTRYVKRNCRCRGYRRVRRVYPRCPKNRPTYKSKCRIRRGKTIYRTVRYYRRVVDRRRCRCGIRVIKRSYPCSCTNRKIRKVVRCIRHRWIYTVLSRLVINRRLNRCVRRVIRRRRRYVACRVPRRNRYKCNKKSGVLYYIYYRAYVRNCKCRVIRRVRKVGRCTCPRRLKKVSDRCNRRTCRRYIKRVGKRLYRRRCINYYRTQVLKCCCPKARSRKWCSARRGYWITQITTYVLKNSRRCVARRTTRRKKVRCSGRVTRRRVCRYRRYLTIYIYKVLRSGCGCRRRLIRVRRNLRCGCKRSSVRSRCYPRQRKRVITRVSYRLRRYRCIKITKRTSKRVPGCPRGVKRVRGKCNRRNCKIYHYWITFRVNSRCKCYKIVRKRRYDCCCKPKLRKSTRCYGRSGIIVTTFLFRRLNRRTRRCYTIREQRRRKVSCRPANWRRNKKLSRCLPIGRFGIRYIVYRRRVRRGCRCINQKIRKACHCRCRGPRRRSICRFNRIRYVYTYSYRFNGCRCRRRTRRRIYRINCARRNRKITGRCRRCRQVVTRIYYRARGCRCIKSVRRTRRVCCCRPTVVRRRCIAHRIKSRKVIRYRFVPYRCIRIVRNFRKLVRCPPSRRIRHTRCRGRKYVVTRLYFRRRNCACSKVIRRITRPCPCRRRRRIVGGCNRRTCKRSITIVYYVLIKFRCIRRTRRSARRCCCRRRPVRRVVCRGNRKISEYFWTVLRGRTCARLVRRRDITPRCAPRRSVRTVCRGRRRITTIITKRLIRCRCYRRRRVIVQRCSCNPPRRPVTRCVGNRIRVTSRVYWVLIRFKCYRRVSRRKRVVVCRRPVYRRYGCNRRSCVRTTVTFFRRVRGCRCRLIRSVSRVPCCCKPYLRTRVRRYCDSRSGRIITKITSYRFNNRRKRCIRRVKVLRRRVRCSRKVTKRVGRCNIRRGERRYQVVLTIRRRRLACKCLVIKRRRTRPCYCGRSKTNRRCVRGVIVISKVIKRLVIRRGRRFCKVTTRIIGRKMVPCKRPYLKRGPCRRGRIIYYKVIHVKRGCKCQKRMYKRSVPCRCAKKKVKYTCNRRRNVVTKLTISFIRVCPRSRYGWLRCRCIRKITRRRRRVRCRRPAVFVSKCKRGKRTKRVVFSKLANCRCYKRVVVRRRRCKTCYNILSKRACRRANRRRKVCVRSPLYRKHLCKYYCKSCKPCAKGPKKVKYYRKPRRGLKTDKRYRKRYVIKKIKVPYTRKGIRICKKKCANNKLCKSFEVIKPRRTKPGSKPSKKPKKCTCVLQTVTPRTLRKLERKNYKGSKAPKRTLFVRHCRKACKKNKVYRRVGRCRCNRALKICHALIRVTWERANRRGKCVKRSKLLRASCRRPCVNIRSKKVCKRLTRRGGCRRRSVRAVCNKSCMPRCRCRKSYKVFSPCRRVGRRLITYLTYVKVRRVLKVCTVKIYRRSKICKRCNARTRVRTVIGRCVRNKRTITTYTYYRAIRKGRQVCLRKTRRVRQNCRGCCPSVVTRITPCRGGRRVRTRIYWARIRNCCRRKVVRETYRCNRCPRDSRRNGPCRYGVRVEFRFWYARSATTGRCYRRKVIRVRSCSRRLR